MHQGRVTRRPRGRAVLLLVAVLGLAVLGGAQPVSAQWLHVSSGSGKGSATNLPAVTGASVVTGGILAPRDRVLTWNTTAIGSVPATGYVVERWTPTGTVSSMNSGDCRGTTNAYGVPGVIAAKPAARQTCTDTIGSLDNTAYRYTVRAVFNAWLGPRTVQLAPP